MDFRTEIKKISVTAAVMTDNATAATAMTVTAMTAVKIPVKVQPAPLAHEDRLDQWDLPASQEPEGLRDL